MIQIPREALGRYWQMMRKSVLAGKARGPCPMVLCEAGKRGLALCCEQFGVGLRLNLVGRFPTGAACVPGHLLAQLEGPQQDQSVRVEQTGPQRGKATWHDSSGERVLEYDSVRPETLKARPAVVAATADPGEGFLQALAEASATAARESYLAVGKVLLRGGEGGIIVGTDGKQLLVHSGFALPWEEEDLLIPALPAFFGCRELASSQGGVRIGRSVKHVAVECGCWTLTLEANNAERFPDYARVLPSPEQPCTRLRLHPDDVAFLLRGLLKLPCPRRERCEVTLDLSSQPKVLPHCESGKGEEALPLARSSVEGKPLSVVTDRQYLVRALRLGFTQIEVQDPERPLCCRDQKRVYAWMPLGDRNTTTNGAAPQQRHRREEKPPVPDNGDDKRLPEAVAPDAIDPLAEAETVRALLHEALGRTSRLVAALKQFRKQSRAVSAALRSLRELPALPQ